MSARRTTTVLFSILLFIVLIQTEAYGEDSHPLALRFGLGTGFQNVSFPIEGYDIGAKEIGADPNVPVYLSLGISWKSVGFGAKIDVPGSLAETEEKGSTDYSNYQLQFYGRRYAVDLVFQQHWGMYINNTGEIDVPIEDPLLPNLVVQTIGATFLWSGNPEINLKTAFKFDKAPKKSRLGLVWMLAGSRVSIAAGNGPGSGIPALAGSPWAEPMFIQTHSLAAGPGITAMVTWSSFFVSPLATLGLGAQRSNFAVTAVSGPDTGQQWSVAPQLSLRLSAGYNAQDWYLVALVSADARNVQTPYLEANQGSVLIELLFGKRYTMRRWRGTRAVKSY